MNNFIKSFDGLELPYAVWSILLGMMLVLEHFSPGMETLHYYAVLLGFLYTMVGLNTACKLRLRREKALLGIRTE